MRQLSLNQITLCADGSLGIQWLKQVVEDGEVIASEPHRSAIDLAAQDSNAQMDAVFEHLESMKYKTNNAQRNRMKKLVRDVLAIGRGDAEIEQRRQEKIAQRAATQE